MKMIGILLTIFFEIILMSLNVIAGNQSVIFNNSLIIYHPYNISQDNSTYKATAVVVGNPVFSSDTNSTFFDGNSWLRFQNISQYTTTLNYSFFCWLNIDGSTVTTNINLWFIC